jgi:hypothetical protein
MEQSPKVFSIKRRLESIFSPVGSCSQPLPGLNSTNQQSSKRKTGANRRINFCLSSQLDSPVSSLPKSNLNLMDENSCDSGFSESSFELYDKFEARLNINSPFAELQSVRTQSVRHLKTKSKSVGCSVGSQTVSSYDETVIKHALDLHHHQSMQTERFVGDLSRKHTLPILAQSKHNDLASISPKTVRNQK